jgi:hypothetical protein
MKRREKQGSQADIFEEGKADEIPLDRNLKNLNLLQKKIIIH